MRMLWCCSLKRETMENSNARKMVDWKPRSNRETNPSRSPKTIMLRPLHAAITWLLCVRVSAHWRDPWIAFYNVRSHLKEHEGGPGRIFALLLVEEVEAAELTGRHFAEDGGPSVSLTLSKPSQARSKPARRLVRLCLGVHRGNGEGVGRLSVRGV